MPKFWLVLIVISATLLIVSSVGARIATKKKNLGRRGRLALLVMTIAAGVALIVGGVGYLLSS